MAKLVITTILFYIILISGQAQSLLVEAESFDHCGGWVVDQEFIPSMGSSYLLAHRLGEPVENAVTTVTFPQKGKYHYWVRTKDWVPDSPYHPGEFKLLINGKEQKSVFGTNEFGWQWIYGGSVRIPVTVVKLELKDLTGFEGRCDAVYFSKDKEDPPLDSLKEMATWREKLGLAASESAGTFDLVVVGGGLSGCCAAVAAARKGLSVALINDRPVLGGVASQEIRVATEGIPVYTIVDQLNTLHYPNGDTGAIQATENIMRVVNKEKNIDLFLNTYINGVEKTGNKIMEVLSMNTLTSKKTSFQGKFFVDATGDGWVGYYAGASYMMGRESESEFNESLAPGNGDNMTMGNSLLWNSYDAGKPTSFPKVPWAMNVAKDYKMKGGEWYWEYGMQLNTIYDAEQIRDHLFRAIYGTWANVKADPANANLNLNWVAYIAGKRESRRLVGQYVLTENDVINHLHFSDGFVQEIRDIDIHYPKPGKYDFLSEAHFTPIHRYEVPYRCLVSKDIRNLFMAGRCFSATHVGLGSPRVMNTCGQMGVVVGSAASICIKKDCTPMEVYFVHLDELGNILEELKIKKDVKK